MMVAGKPLTRHITEVLFINAYEMWNEKKERQEIRSRRYIGFISTNLQVFSHFGTPCVKFESVVTEIQEQWGVNQVRFIVRIDDLSVPPDVAFGRIMQMEGPPMMHPMDLYQHDDDNEPEYDLGEPTYG